MRHLTCDDMDPPWINKDIKKLIHEKNQACKSYLILHHVTRLSKKLLDRMASLKTYWSIFKTF